jgi:predicted lipid-binding transport protein (Tim44 family)
MYVYGGALIPDGTEPHAIAASDPAFSRNDFLEFATSVHRNVHAAIASGDPRAIAGVTSEPLRSALLARRSERAWQHAVERVDHVSILEASHAAADTIVVRFGSIIGGKVVEDWVFTRNACEYPHLTGVVPTSCAACGAPLATDARGNCRYCATHVVGVAGDWQVYAVLPPRVIEAPPGPSSDDLLGPEHQMDHLLAFARSIYANVHRATASGAVATIRSVLTAQMRSYLESNPDDHCWGVPIHRIDSVDVVDVRRGQFEVVTVRIQAATDGGTVLEDWTFERPASLPGRETNATECVFCGAPIALDERGNCTYCQTHLLGVAGDWRLARAVQPSQMATHPVVIRAMQSRFGRISILLFLLGGFVLTIALFAALFL